MIDSPAHLVNSKILVIDDEQIVLDVITAHLNVAGYWNIVGISDSIDAVGRLKQEEPDLILVDISMPDVSGNYLIQFARSDEALKSVPIIVVTAIDSQETHGRALMLGADTVLKKPFPRETLIDHVESALKKRHQQSSTADSVKAATQEGFDHLHDLG